MCSVPGWTELRRRHCLQSHLFLLCTALLPCNQSIHDASVHCVCVCVQRVRLDTSVRPAPRPPTSQVWRRLRQQRYSLLCAVCCVVCGVCLLTIWLSGWLQRVRRAPTTRWSTNRAPTRASVSLVFALIWSHSRACAVCPAGTYSTSATAACSRECRRAAPSA